MDKDTFWDLVNPLQEPLFRFAYSILRNPEDAQDAVQDVLEKMWYRRKQIKNDGREVSYSMKIIKNHCIDILRKKKRILELEADDMEMTYSSNNDYEHKDLLSFIEAKLNHLPVNQRMIIELKDFQGFDYEEISEVMEIPVANLRVYLGRARKFVLKGIEDEV